MTGRSYLVLQALTLLKLAKVMRNPAATLKAAELQERSTESREPEETRSQIDRDKASGGRP
jgi:hypothetical protein